MVCPSGDTSRDIHVPSATRKRTQRVGMIGNPSTADGTGRAPLFVCASARSVANTISIPTVAVVSGPAPAALPNTRADWDIRAATMALVLEPQSYGRDASDYWAEVVKLKGFVICEVV